MKEPDEDFWLKADKVCWWITLALITFLMVYLGSHILLTTVR